MCRRRRGRIDREASLAGSRHWQSSVPGTIRTSLEWLDLEPGHAGALRRRQHLRHVFITHALVGHDQTAEIELTIEGEARSTTATGNGPVDAVFNGIRQLCPHTAVLELYQVSAVTEGTDAQATVSVRLADQGLAATGKASDPDTLVASARAYVHALNKLEVRRAKAMAA